MIYDVGGLSVKTLWVMFMEFGELLFGRRFPLRLEGAVYMCYVRPVIMYGMVAWYLKESEMGILQMTERYMVRVMCCVQLKDRQISTDLMLMFGLNGTIDQLAMANSACWYVHVLRREDGHVLIRVLDFEIDGQWKKLRPKRTWKKQVEEESVNFGLRRKDALCRSKWNVDVNLIVAGLG